MRSLADLLQVPVVEQNLSRLTKVFPYLFWKYIDRKSVDLGLNGLCVILSFDCDTTDDIPAAQKLFRRLQQLKMKATFCVPGVQLEKGAEVYHAMAREGAEFLNHGYNPHVVWKNGAFESTTFYSDMTLAEIEDDMKRGHSAVMSVTGKAPRGFRTPHFGLFNNSEQLQTIHRILKKMEYQYSSSTMPIYSLTRNLMWRDGHLVEIPLSGNYFAPLMIFDSYSNLPKNGSNKVDRNYGDKFLATIEQLTRRNCRGILNFYADPVHVCDSEDYDQALQFLVQLGIPVIGYDDLLQLARV